MDTISDKALQSQATGFLDQFPTQQRSLVANQFFSGVRAGARSVGEVIAAVDRDARERLAAGLHVDTQTLLLELLATPAAREFAMTIIARESLPVESRKREKAERASLYQKEWMKAQPPTRKQLEYLRVLRCDLIPRSRLEASELINERRVRGFVW